MRTISFQLGDSEQWTRPIIFYIHFFFFSWVVCTFSSPKTADTSFELKFTRTKIPWIDSDAMCTSSKQQAAFLYKTIRKRKTYGRMCDFVWHKNSDDFDMFALQRITESCDVQYVFLQILSDPAVSRKQHGTTRMDSTRTHGIYGAVPHSIQCIIVRVSVVFFIGTINFDVKRTIYFSLTSLHAVTPYSVAYSNLNRGNIFVVTLNIARGLKCIPICGCVCVWWCDVHVCTAYN